MLFILVVLFKFVVFLIKCSVSCRLCLKVFIFFKGKMLLLFFVLFCDSIHFFHFTTFLILKEAFICGIIFWYFFPLIKKRVSVCLHLVTMLSPFRTSLFC